MRFLPIALIVAGNVVYHLGQKTMPAAAPALAATFVAYVVAGLACLLCVPFFAPDLTLAASRNALHWSPVLVGLGAFAIEVGFLLAYRAGWEISVASLSANVLLALVLVPIGVLAFREAWTLQRGLGLLLCLGGLWLLRSR
jgi:hypothetical protein